MFDEHAQIDPEQPINYEELKNISDGIERGDITVIRLNGAEERGRIKGGRRNVEATILLGASERASGRTEEGSRYVSWEDHKAAVKPHEDLLEIYAKDKGIWFEFDDFINDDQFLDNGMEADVFYDETTNTVVKAIGYDFAERISPLEFIDNRIAVHNTLFPGTRYELIGFAKDNHGFFRFVLRQPHIQKFGKVTYFELKEHLKDYYGMTISKKNMDSFVNTRYVVWDLHGLNIIKSKSGMIHFIDPIVSLNFDNFEVPPLQLKAIR